MPLNLEVVLSQVSLWYHSTETVTESLTINGTSWLEVNIINLKQNIIIQSLIVAQQQTISQPQTKEHLSQTLPTFLGQPMTEHLVTLPKTVITDKTIIPNGYNKTGYHSLGQNLQIMPSMKAEKGHIMFYTHTIGDMWITTQTKKTTKSASI